MKNFDSLFIQILIKLRGASDLVFQSGEKARLYLESEGGLQRAVCMEKSVSVIKHSHWSSRQLTKAYCISTASLNILPAAWDPITIHHCQ